MIYLFPRFVYMLVPWRLLFVMMKLPMTLNRPGLHGGGWDYSLFFFAFFQFVIVPLNLCASSPLRWDGTPSLTRHIHLLVCNGFDGAWPNCSKWVLTGGHTSSNQRLTWNTRKSLGGICAHLFFFSTKKQSETSIDGRPEFPNLFHQFFFPPSDFVEGKPEAKNRRMIFIRRAVLFLCEIFMGSSTSAKPLRFTMDPNWVMMCHLAPPGLSRCEKSTVPSRPENRWLFTSTSWK